MRTNQPMGWLRRDIARAGNTLGADHRPFLPKLESFGNAEVHQLYITVVVDHHIRWFHVPEDDRVGFMVMQERKHIA